MTMMMRGIRQFSWLARLGVDRRPLRGLFGLDGLNAPDDFERLGRAAIAECRRLKTEITSSPPSLRTVQDLDAISNAVCGVIDAAELCRNVHPDESDTFGLSFEQLSDFIQQLNADVDMYQCLRAVTEDVSLMTTFTEEQQRVAQLLRAEFERDGIHLDADGRQRVIDLQNEITRSVVEACGRLQAQPLSMQFQHNIHATHSYIEVPTKALRTIPLSLRKQCIEQPDGTTAVPTDVTMTNAVLKWVADPDVRKRMYIAGNSCATANLEVLDQLIATRHALATTLGFETYSHLATSDKMVGSPQRVDEFLRGIAANLMTKASEERALLVQAKTKHEGKGFFPDPLPLESWDVPYYMGMLKAKAFDLDARVIASYFPLEQCLHGLGLICDELFGVTLTTVAVEPGETWHPDVRKVSVTKDGRELGTLYLDLFPRKHKYHHAAHFTVRCGKQLPSGEYQTPIAALVCNFSPPDPSRPSLLTFAAGKCPAYLTGASHGEVETLFHEFGHALHSLLSHTEFQHLSGTRGQLDFVETPSHLFEYFAWDERVVSAFARHYATGDPIPAAMLANLKASKHMFSAMETQTQCLYSLLDLTLFRSQPLPFVPPTTTQALAELQNAHTLVPYVAGTHWHARFGHLVGYGAGYYSYLYARVFAAEIWGKCLAADPWAPAAGRVIYDELFRHGGAKEPMTMLTSLLGHAPTSARFITELGVTDG
ncbi:mitochondrial intermediate peptidase [Achlya hypogyna]|uniref:Mitochondrial intermediate peptidase n=1 Tax=Achlya hypogyna TaxID=1202772 RepID=A0A1V9ZFV8_ACHHY|nr:mitochondrial intermediate peptidase [Achlya hypogyna]